MPTATLTFEGWMTKVDTFVRRKIGMSVHDLADQCWRDMYDSGETPEEAGKYALEEEGFEDDE